MLVYGVNEVNNDHLKDVKKYMTEHGVPTIRVVDCEDYYQAIEGSHRLLAAEQMEIEPNWIILDQNDEIDLDILDIEVYDEEIKTAGELARYIAMNGNAHWDFEI